MTLAHLEDREYGPFAFEISAAKVAEYVHATGDDPDRWSEYAPPSYAGAVLFKAAPSFLFDPEVAPYAKLLIHGDQQFTWPEPWRIGSAVIATARVDRMRERGGVNFATFVMDVHDEDGRHVLGSKAQFLMSEDTPPGGQTPERVEPAPEERQANVIASPIPPTPGKEMFISMDKSASRSDLVRYASASEDFNPMHWDHDRSNAAGVGGVICHGLLMAAWTTQPVTSLSDRVDPLESARFRFRLPLRPNEPAQVRTVVAADGAAAKSTVVTGDTEHVAATLTIRV